MPDRIPTDNGYLVDVPEDMSIDEFAKLNGTTPERLRELNPGIPDQLLKSSSYIIPKN